MKNPWSAFYWLDYAGDTRHLSMLEHGAYLLLLSHYYVTGKPLARDVSVLYRICGAVIHRDMAAIDSVLAQFFKLQQDGWHNKRADEELARRDEIRGSRNSKKNLPQQNVEKEKRAVDKYTQSQSQSQSQKPKTVESDLTGKPILTPEEEEWLRKWQANERERINAKKQTNSADAR